jgi:hypothetical protein
MAAGAWVQSTPQAHHLHAVGDLLVQVLVIGDVVRDQEVDTRGSSLEDCPLRLDGAEELAQQAGLAKTGRLGEEAVHAGVVEQVVA